MQLYGAKVSQKYIQLTDGKKRLKYRYPNSTQYPCRKEYHYGSWSLRTNKR